MWTPQDAPRSRRRARAPPRRTAARAPPASRRAPRAPRAACRRCTSARITLSIDAPEHRHQRDRQQDVGERHHRVDDAHDRRVEPAEEAGDQAEQRCRTITEIATTERADRQRVAARRRRCARTRRGRARRCRTSAPRRRLAAGRAICSVVGSNGATHGASSASSATIARMTAASTTMRREQHAAGGEEAARRRRMRRATAIGAQYFTRGSTTV